MRVYLSGPQGSWRSEMEGHHLLVSYAESRQIKLLDAGWDVPGWLVDSGAFTAWTKGRPIDLDAYIGFLVDLEAKAAPFASLIDGFLEDPVTIAKDMDDVKGDTAAIVGGSLKA